MRQSLKKCKFILKATFSLLLQSLLLNLPIVSWAAVNEMNASKEISLKHLKCNITITQAKGNFRGKENQM